MKKRMSCLSSTIVSVIVLSLSFLLSSCGEKKEIKFIKDIYARLDEGTIISDEVYFTNKSGQDLTEVKVKVTLIGDNAKSVSFKAFWSYWKQGEEKCISVPVAESVTNIQKVEMEGRCIVEMQGRCDDGILLGLEWLFEK